MERVWLMGAIVSCPDRGWIMCPSKKSLQKSPLDEFAPIGRPLTWRRFVSARCSHPSQRQVLLGFSCVMAELCTVSDMNH